MGRTYHANNPSLKTFDVNFAGADLLGFFHGAIGMGLAPMVTEEQRRFWADRPPCTLFSMDAKTATECADALERLDVAEFIKNLKADGWMLESMFVGTPEELHEFILEWAQWLRESNGYEVDG